MRIPTKLGRASLAIAVLACAALGLVGRARANLANLSAGASRAPLAPLEGEPASAAAQAHPLGALLPLPLQAAAAAGRHEHLLASGVVVHEYVSKAGAVYAVAWHGPRMPDLRALLGPSFVVLAGAARAPGGGHHRATRRGDDLVVHSTGHAGSFAGRAWIPSLVPAGVDVVAELDAREREVAQ